MKFRFIKSGFGALAVVGLSLLLIVTFTMEVLGQEAGTPAEKSQVKEADAKQAEKKVAPAKGEEGDGGKVTQTTEKAEALAGHVDVPAISTSNESSQGTGIPNPAIDYCEDLGYTVELVKISFPVKEANGEKSEGETAETEKPKPVPAGGAKESCIFPDGTSCEVWKFFRAECGKQYSFCNQQGFKIENRKVDMDGWEAAFAVCVFPDGSECLEVDYMNEKCSPSECKKWDMAEGGCVK